jgi:hypothetical protein
MAEAHETIEHAEHAEHAAHSNKGIALLISVLALFLALSETLGKSAQTEALSANVEASDLWAFYQAKTIRMGQVQTAADSLTLTSSATSDPALKAAQEKQIETWKKEAARSDDDPGRNGRKQLTERAKAAEHRRDTALAKYHHFEVASAAFQIGIVLASATIITGMIALAWISGVLAIAGIGMTALGIYAPHLLHLH